jgi:secreted trypsin-like serine protease
LCKFHCPIYVLQAFGSKIVGGKDADIKDFPWIVLLAPLRKTSGRMVLMNHGPSYVCGGSIISDKWILTASHCICHHEETRLFDGYAHQKSYNLD